MSEQTDQPKSTLLIIEAGEDTHVLQFPSAMQAARIATLLSTHPKVQAITNCQVTAAVRQVRQPPAPTA